MIPQWFLEHYEIKGNELQGTWYSATNDFKAKDIRAQVFGSLVNGKFCADCNNGWMCDLEAEVKPLLLSLAANERSVDRLTNAERLLLSRWAVKTSAALNHASNFHALVRPEHAAAVESGPPVEGTFVFARQVPEDLRDPISWNQSVGAGPTLKPSEMELPEVLEAFDEGWRIILLIGRLLLLTTYFPRATGFCTQAGPRIRRSGLLGNRFRFSPRLHSSSATT